MVRSLVKENTGRGAPDTAPRQTQSPPRRDDAPAYQDAPSDALYIGEMVVNDYLKVHFSRIDAHGQHILIDAPNDSGKSSLLEAFAATAETLAAKGATGPIHKGASEASVELELQNAQGLVEYRVKRTWVTRIDPKTGEKKVITGIEVRNGEGVKQKEAADLYKGFISRVTIDCGRFLTLRPVDQVDVVLRKAGVEWPGEELFKITGERHVLLPGETTGEGLERLSADEKGLYYNRRRDQHGICEQKFGALKEQRELVARLGGPLKPSEKPRTPGALLARAKVLNAQVEARRAAQKVVDEQASGKTETLRNEQQLEREKQSAVNQRDGIQHRIDDLRRQLAQAEMEKAAKEVEIKSFDTRIERTRDLVAGWDNDLRAAKDALDALPDPTLELTQISRDLETVEADNKLMNQRVAACEDETRLAGEFEMETAKHKKLDDQVEQIRYLRAHLLDGFDLGLDDLGDADDSTMKLDLTIADKELKVNGVSFAQASKAQQILVSAGLGMLEDPRLRVLRVDDLERLDFESRKLLFAVAKKRKYQVMTASVNNTRKKRDLRVQIVEEYAGQEMEPDATVVTD